MPDSVPATSILHSAFEQALEQHGYTADPSQRVAVDHLAAIHSQLVTSMPPGSALGRLRRRLPGKLARLAPPRGAYLWGSVGRGKTFVMDVFFESLPFDDKLRYHFHRLMYRVHNRLAALVGESDPLEIVAGELADQARVICFDEFFVTEIGDAMILGKLLQGLFRRGVCLVATSNTPPNELYRDGLQRAQFLPAIALLEQHTHVIRFDGATDFRLRLLEQAELWHAPLDTAAEENLERYFASMAPEAGTAGQSIEILGRDIQTRRRADGIIWFDFAALCDGPRSQNDYIEIARTFQTVLLSNVPELGREQENQARRFVALIDEFYERRVKLIVSAALPYGDIYRGQRLTHEFRRTVSRLTEMQSHEYLSSAHIV